MIASFNIANVKTSNLFREARMAMLTHQAIHHIDLADQAAEKVEQAAAVLVEATHRPDRPQS
ncbi:hypothetical protein FJ987_08355 [Mesorhizobium sp. CU2]|uniref:hypothetical protein n=1 Tax=unclassified Mesorhizobium TaxID=325217 RepID=UPI0011295D68|nr:MULTISPECIES: hypothetical protein [unclassified Mesorhizobium]TPN89833.1 hypothetical protein FJ988_02660 [Mesorhizobium sp. CU3]TPO17920.1 hypothetical protein FJ987_08355 [Mesorhizobium sp. CU2]